MPIIAMPSTIADAASVVDWDATLPVSDPQSHGLAEAGCRSLQCQYRTRVAYARSPHVRWAVAPIIVSSQAGPGSTFLFAS
ncbi:MAG: hypothetical protein K0S73_2839 [Stenotrophomonas rhizophila]|jgi:hypothetical protein|nr:hypothetical protein [Stenotrophomonas rhizophila]